MMTESPKPNFQTVDDIFGLWPSVSEFARDIGLKRESHGTIMKRRQSIPATHWPRIVEAAKKRGFKGITLAVLSEIHSKRWSTESNQQGETV